jgi:3-isopropylmalate/(R)-2-methylmalate dehydratase small subunit
VLGLPCLTADHASVDALQSLIEREPQTTVDIRVDSGLVTAGNLTIQAHIPSGMRDAFLTDQWNPTAMLLDKFEQVRAVAASLPYVSGF